MTGGTLNKHCRESVVTCPPCTRMELVWLPCLAWPWSFDPDPGVRESVTVLVLQTWPVPQQLGLNIPWGNKLGIGCENIITTGGYTYNIPWNLHHWFPTYSNPTCHPPPLTSPHFKQPSNWILAAGHQSTKADHDQHLQNTGPKMKLGGGWQVGFKYVGNQWWRFHGILYVYPPVVIIFSHPIPGLFPQGIFNLSCCV